MWIDTLVEAIRMEITDAVVTDIVMSNLNITLLDFNLHEFLAESNSSLVFLSHGY